MKKLFILVALIALVASTAFAQEVDKKWNVYIGGGVGMPMGDFGDFCNMGFHGYGAFGYTVTPGLQIMPTIEYHSFSVKDEFKVPGVSASVKPLLFGANLRYAFKMTSPSVQPYILGGAGMARLEITASAGSVSASVTETDIYFGGGAGVEFKAGPKMGIFIQARYISIATEGSSTSFVPVTVGVKF